MRALIRGLTDVDGCGSLRGLFLLEAGASEDVHQPVVPLAGAHHLLNSARAAAPKSGFNATNRQGISATYDSGYFHEFDMSADGQPFLLIQTEADAPPL
jgi:hypothetical protein